MPSIAMKHCVKANETSLSLRAKKENTQGIVITLKGNYKQDMRRVSISNVKGQIQTRYALLSKSPTCSITDVGQLLQSETWNPQDKDFVGHVCDVTLAKVYFYIVVFTSLY